MKKLLLLFTLASGVAHGQVFYTITPNTKNYYINVGDTVTISIECQTDANYTEDTVIFYAHNGSYGYMGATLLFRIPITSAYMVNSSHAIIPNYKFMPPYIVKDSLAGDPLHPNWKGYDVIAGADQSLFSVWFNPNTVTGIESQPIVSLPTIIETHSYDIQGKEIKDPNGYAGVFITKSLYSDGTAKTTKTVR